MIKVINGKIDGFIGENKIYIGRYNKFYNLSFSVLSNPFVIGKDGSRSDVILKYREWLWSEYQKKQEVYNELIRIAKIVKSGKSVELCCWCKPEDCHGDVLKKSITWIINQEIV